MAQRRPVGPGESERSTEQAPCRPVCSSHHARGPARRPVLDPGSASKVPDDQTPAGPHTLLPGVTWRGWGALPLSSCDREDSSPAVFQGGDTRELSSFAPTLEKGKPKSVCGS